MTPVELGFLGLAAMALLLFTGIPIGIAMAVTGFVGFALVSGLEPALGLLMTVPYSTAGTYTLSVVPLFILMGELSFHSGISQELYRVAYRWLGHLPGGLAMATIGAGAAFGAMCGSSAAATATFGSVALPEMRKFKYQPGFAAATVSAGGTLAIMVPPSTAFIIYGVMTEQSVGKLFIAGIIPGIVLAVLYCLTIYVIARRNPEVAPAGPATSWAEKLGSMGGSWPMVVLFAFVMGGIWLGMFSATEAGAMGAFGALLFMIWRRQFNRTNVIACLTATANISAMIFLILIGASMFSYFLAVTGLPQAIAGFLTGLSVSPYAIIVGILVLYFFLGWFMEELSMVVLTTPLFYPVLVALGVNPIWYGVMVVIAIEQGQLTPPVGLNINIICGMAKDVPATQIFRWVMPYVVVLIVFTFVMIAFPQLALFLPSMMK
ncbi:MAG: TRAP transporter large permease [Chloroflexota bacterium]